MTTQIKIKNCSLLDLHEHTIVLTVEIAGQCHRLSCDAYELWRNLLDTCWVFADAQLKGYAQVDKSVVDAMMHSIFKMKTLEEN